MIDLNGKTILVTGGTGSFGKRFVRRVLSKFRPEKLIVFSRDEFKQYEMQRMMDDPCLRFFIGDVRDKDRLYRAFEGVEYLIHAAALKQVPSAEYNPFEAIKTNIIGAQNIIDVAIDIGIKRIVALSTDKACNPVNLYGATKLCSDKLFIAGNSYAGRKITRFGVVRYGNVVGSRGSVVPHFLQLKKGDSVPVTDERMTRFWITLDQGVDFVLKALDQMKGGEIFVPKIPTATIVDIAKAIVPKCKIKIIGVRPGEKLHELLISIEDGRRTLEYPEHFVIQPDFPWWSDEKRKNGGEPVRDGFVYSSDQNPWRLTTGEIEKMVRELQNG
ncbi:MAG: UDP-N-acetylglucosamine 4,6-dehydratase (inverting) [Candidatus Manganitrophus sp. SB1]|nr:UDP-N-acetylglucosamine 4,6-dehydratase (inverting) [Candidatus Manganitrophus morganii]